MGQELRRRHAASLAAIVLALVAPLCLAAQAEAILRIEFPGGAASLAAAELQALPRDSVKAKLHDGPEQWFAGPSVMAVLRRAGARVDTVRGPALAQVLVAEAADGYRVAFSLGELAPTLGNRTVILVDRIDGKPLPEKEGPWRLLVPADAHPSRWARQVVTLRLIAVGR